MPISILAVHSFLVNFGEGSKEKLVKDQNNIGIRGKQRQILVSLGNFTSKRTILLSSAFLGLFSVFGSFSFLRSSSK